MNEKMANYLSPIVDSITYSSDSSKKDFEPNEFPAIYNFIFENMKESLVITDLDHFIIYANNRFLKTYGFTLEEIKNTLINTLFPANHQTHFNEISMSLSLQGNWSGIIRNKKKDGEEFPVKIKAKKFFSEDYFRHLNLYMLESEKSDKLKTEFLAQMSHEIRTPINSILSFTSLLKEETMAIATDELQSIFKYIDSGGRRLIRTIDMILNMSQLQTDSYEYHLQEIDLTKELLETVLLEFRSIAQEKKLDLKLIKMAEPAIVKIDTYTLEQIFINLIDNAIKYTHKGKVEVELYKNINNNLCVDFRDTGIGISKDYLPYLFTPFSQEEMGYTRKYDGNGLGLALVKKYSEINNVEIIVNTEKNVGSTFTVIFK